MFSDLVCEQLGFYVYGLKDPRDNRYFYIGKGQENRVYSHLFGTDSKSELFPKDVTIKEIREAGLEPVFDIIRWGIADERVAYAIEAAIIDALNVHELTNLVRGHGGSAGYGLLSEREAKEKFEGVEFQSNEAFVGFKLNRLWSPDLTDEELYEVTRKIWRVGRRREKANYALAVSFGIVRQVYRIQRFSSESPWESFTHNRDGKQLKMKKWGFVGHVAEELQHLVNSTVDHLSNTKSRYPVFYINC